MAKIKTTKRVYTEKFFFRDGWGYFINERKSVFMFPLVPPLVLIHFLFDVFILSL